MREDLAFGLEASVAASLLQEHVVVKALRVPGLASLGKVSQMRTANRFASPPRLPLKNDPSCRLSRWPLFGASSRRV